MTKKVIISKNARKIKVFKMEYGWRILTTNKFSDTLDVIELVKKVR